MDKIALISGNIKLAGWEEGVGLEVTFHSGHTWQYPKCPYSEFEEMCSAESVGKYFNQYILPEYGPGKQVK